MFCQNCGSKMNDDAMFCTNCGWKNTQNIKKSRANNKKFIIPIVFVIFISIGIVVVLKTDILDLSFINKNNINQESFTQSHEVENDDLVTPTHEVENDDFVAPAPTEALIEQPTTNDETSIADNAEIFVEQETQEIPEYILPDSDKRLLTVEEVMFLDDTLLQYAINEIYARHGRIYKDEDLNNYFTSKSWYHGLYDIDHFDTSCFSNIEWQNIDLLTKVRDSRKK